MGSVARYMAGLCVATLGACAGGWLVLTPFAFGYPGHGRAAVTALSTGGGLVVTGLAALACWAMLWRRKLRADGVLLVRPSRRARRSERRQAKAERLVRASRQRELAAAPDPAQVLTDLRALLTPLLTEGVGAVEVLPAPESLVAHETPEVAPEIVPEPVAEVVEVPGHLRGTRSASFLAAPRPRAAVAAEEAQDEPLLHGAELLMVGSGEEEAW